MTRYNSIAVYAVLSFIYGFLVEISSTQACKPHELGDVKVSISNIKNKPGLFYTQVKVDEGPDYYNGKKSCYKINIQQDTSCGPETPNKNTKCFQDSPGPFYERVRGMGFYKLHTQSKTWKEAKAICEREGAHLAIMNSAEEVALLQEFRRRLPRLHGNGLDDLVYLGFNDIQTEGVWVTIFNEPLYLTGYTNWELGEPNNGTNENCGCIVLTSGRIHDCLCSDVIPFFCELELSDCCY
ncbi:Hemolymph lipopolysaccharide-binding protein [Blattella germanica]|nr:Hemolymph lipopolysaccharide-binding protein [Blattella germanica]